MNKLTKIKSIVSGIFKNIPVYVEIYTKAMKEATEQMQGLIPVPMSGEDGLNNFMKIYIEVVSEGINENRKEIERVLRGELKTLSMKQLDFLETALSPEVIKSMTKLNFAVMPIMLKIAMGVCENEAFLENATNLFNFDDESLGRTTKKKVKVKRFSSSRTKLRRIAANPYRSRKATAGAVRAKRRKV